MTRKTDKRTLRLAKESLAHLSGAALAQVRGGEMPSIECQAHDAPKRITGNCSGTYCY